MSGANESPELTGSRLTLFIAVSAGLAISNCYAIQPALPEIAGTLGTSISAIGILTGALQIGYMFGIVFVAPLGDKLTTSKLVTAQYLGLAIALFAAAKSPNLTAITMACLLVGAMASLAVSLSSLAFKLAPSTEKGHAVGSVAIGISAGILLSRFIGGELSHITNWRFMLSVFGSSAAIFGFLSWRLLPLEKTTNAMPYRELLWSLIPIWRKYKLLREGSIVGACWFFVFSTTWVTLMLHVRAAPMHMTEYQAGLLGIAGASGLFATKPAGQLTDRYGARKIILSGLLIALVGFSIIALQTDSPPLLVIGIVLFDAGCFSCQVANQTRLMAIDGTTRSRIYSVYMVIYYAAGATGSALGPWILDEYGWHSINMLCFGVTCIGLFLAIWHGKRA